LGALLAEGLNNVSVETTSDFSTAIRYARANPACFVLLDSELEDIELSAYEMAQGLRQVSAQVNLILVSRPGENINLHSLPLRGTLTKPISLPRLKKLLQPAAENESLAWLKDVGRAARHLTRLMMESSAQAALITRENALWAYAGQLSQEAAQELADSLQKQWGSTGNNDLLKFIRLETTGVQHMLYARRLAEGMALAMVLDAETPLSAIRAQTGQLIRSLEEVSPEATNQMSLQEAAALEEDDLPPISELLGEVPPPLPPKPAAFSRSAQPWEVSTAVETPRPARQEPITEPPPAAKLTPSVPAFSLESSPPIRRQESFSVPDLNVTRAQRVSQPENDPSLAETRAQTPKGDPQSVIETQPQSVTEVARRIVLEPASAAMYNLYYACLLIPCFQNHLLVGDLSDRLTEWVPKMCRGFGWRLEYLATRPDYLQWVVSVPPATAPGYIIRVLRQHTSERIFSEFPRFKSENISSDFWAPGYLIMGGQQPHPPQIVRDFIQHTRQRQGFLKE